MQNSSLPNVLEWQSYEYVHRERSVDWFWGVGLAGLVSGIISILLGNILLAVLIIVGSVSVTIVTLRHPKIQSYALTPRGALEGNVMYPWSELASFWIIESESPQILLKPKRPLAPLVTLPLPETVDTEAVHNYLFQYIDDEPLEESLTQIILERLGF